MASLSLSASATSPPNLILGFPPRPSIPTLIAVQIRTFASPASSTLSLKVSTRLQINQRQLTVFATNSNSAASQKPSNEEGVVETSKASEGPPLLTILAGAFVFFTVCWLIGSVVMWLISLIVNVPSPK